MVPFIIIIIVLTLLILGISFLGFWMVFYSKNDDYAETDEITLPNNDIYNSHRDLIIQDIKDVRDYRYQEYSIQSFDGLTLKAKYFESIKGAPIEIMFHGYRGSGERDLSTGVKRAFLCGRNAFVVDQRGCGLSEGHIISFGINEQKDCLNWIDFVIEQFGSDVKIILTGISMGASTVLLAAGHNLPKNVVGVLADCGYHRASEIIKKVMRDMKLPAAIIYPFVKLGARIFGNFKLEETSPYEAVIKSNLPIIFIHGSEDKFVPLYMSQKLYDACGSKKKHLVVIKDAGHGLAYLTDPNTYIDELNKFFNE